MTAKGREKLRQCILYFLEHINNVHLGRMKLMKLLYYVDFDHYEKHGRSVTGAKYRKLPHGPVPDEAQSLIDALVEKGEIREFSAPRHTYMQKRLATVTGAFDASVMTAEELLTLQSVAQRWEDATASEIEAASHAEAPWQATADGKIVDYELACLRTPEGWTEAEKELVNSPRFKRYVVSLGAAA